MLSDKVKINGWNVWYDRVGSGPHPLLLIPGFLGTSSSDFSNQLTGEAALDLEMFSIVCIELVGWGRSRPPQRPYGPLVLDMDVICCIELMETLGYHKFSVLGWSHGGRVALRLAYIYPEKVNKMILIGVASHVPKDRIDELLTPLDMKKWRPQKIEPYIQIYGDLQLVKKLWAQFLKYIAIAPDYFPNGVCNLNDIKCPTLYVYGDRDPIIKNDHVEMTFNGISDIILARFPLGSHDVHKKFANQFKKLVEIFMAD